MNLRPNDRAAHEWTIPAQAAQWLEAGVDSIESGRLRPAADRARRMHAWFEQVRRRLFMVAIVAVSAFLLWHVVYGANGAMVFHQKRATVKKLQTRIDTLKQDNAAATKHVEALKSDPHTIESEARKQFHFVRPGEFVYVQPTEQSQAPPVPPANATARKD